MTLVVKAPATKPDDLSTVPRTYPVEGENWLPLLSSDLYTHILWNAQVQAWYRHTDKTLTYFKVPVKIQIGKQDKTFSPNSTQLRVCLLLGLCVLRQQYTAQVGRGFRDRICKDSWFIRSTSSEAWRKTVCKYLLHTTILPGPFTVLLKCTCIGTVWAREAKTFKSMNSSKALRRLWSSIIPQASHMSQKMARTHSNTIWAVVWMTGLSGSPLTRQAVLFPGAKHTVASPSI